MVSQRFETPCAADPLDVYRVLRATNPSPYMYLLRLAAADGERFDIVGSSPEALVTVLDGVATTHPIAGTRWRGATEEEDVALEKDLRTDEKERAEHVMLVDLGRNDLGRVCEPGTVKVRSFFSVERYSHVMHLVSTVTGLLRRDRTAFDAVTACFPAGTLSGAPKPRAMEIIEELEPTRRGPLRRHRRATSTSRATPTPRSPSAPRWCATGSPTCRRAAGSWPTPTRSPRTPSASTRRALCSPRWPPRPRSPRRRTEARSAAVTVRSHASLGSAHTAGGAVSPRGVCGRAGGRA